MGVLPKLNEGTRRRRYERTTHKPATLTLNHLRLLGYLADYALMSTLQLSLLDARSEKSTRRFMRMLYDAGLVEVIPICRAALAEADTPVAETLYGSAPNLYRLTRAGIRFLISEGVRERCKSGPEIGPLAVGLRHFLGMNDVRIWLDRTAMLQPHHNLIRWKDGHDAAIPLSNSKSLRPDAWFVFGIANLKLVGLVEFDRNTERGQVRWLEKISGYTELFSGRRLVEMTGYRHARVLVVVPSERRRDLLADFISKHVNPSVAGRFWLTCSETLAYHSLVTPQWRQATDRALKPLLTTEQKEP